MNMRMLIHRSNVLSRPGLIKIAGVLALAFAWSMALQANAQASAVEDLQEQIQTYSALAQRAVPPSTMPVPAGQIWSHLASLYEDAGMYGQAEMAYLRAVRLLKTPPVSERDLANALDGLGTLYMVRGETELAERTEQKALAIREANKLVADLVPSWYHLATLALRQHQFDKARTYAERAIDQLNTQREPDPDQQINAGFVLGLALCRLHKYPDAIAAMQNAMSVVQRAYRPEDFPVGFGSFLLGYAYWKSGDASAAKALLHDGSASVERHLGWQHPVTVSIMTQYESFLRATNQKEAANSIRQEVKHAQSLPGFRQAPEMMSVASLF